MPRAPHAALQGSSGLSWRGDAMVPFTVFQNNNGSTTALRVGNMKYTSSGRLYDLSTDLLEPTDISGAQPGVAANMAQQLNDIVNGNGVRE